MTFNEETEEGVKHVLARAVLGLSVLLLVMWQKWVSPLHSYFLDAPSYCCSNQGLLWCLRG